MLLEEKDYYSGHAGVKRRAIFCTGSRCTRFTRKIHKTKKEKSIERLLLKALLNSPI
jgi:hypothetical protein